MLIITQNSSILHTHSILYKPEEFTLLMQQIKYQILTEI